MTVTDVAVGSILVGSAAALLLWSLHKREPSNDRDIIGNFS